MHGGIESRGKRLSAFGDVSPQRPLVADPNLLAQVVGFLVEVSRSTLVALKGPTNW